MSTLMIYILLRHFSIFIIMKDARVLHKLSHLSILFFLQSVKTNKGNSGLLSVLSFIQCIFSLMFCHGLDLCSQFLCLFPVFLSLPSLQQFVTIVIYCVHLPLVNSLIQSLCIYSPCTYSLFSLVCCQFLCQFQVVVLFLCLYFSREQD